MLDTFNGSAGNSTRVSSVPVDNAIFAQGDSKIRGRMVHTVTYVCDLLRYKCFNFYAVLTAAPPLERIT